MRATRESILLSIGRWLLTTATAVLIERASLDRHRSLQCLGNNRWRHSPRALLPRIHDFGLESDIKTYRCVVVISTQRARLSSLTVASLHATSSIAAASRPRSSTYMYVHHVDGARKNVVKNSGTTVKNSTVKNRKSSVSYTITYFLLCFARQAWLLWRFGVRQPPKSGIQDPGSSCWMADGCTKLGREGAGTFQCPRPFYVGRNLTFPSRGTFQCRGSGPGKAPRHARKAYSKSWAAAAQPGPDPWH